VKLIFIYGPPAAGKLTVAEALAALTGFKVFHNHLTVDLAHAFFEFGTPAFGRYVDHLRLEAVEMAAREGVDGVIFTFVYALGWDDGFVQDMKDVVERSGGVVFFVQLVCSRDILEGRVAAKSRQRFRKIKDIGKLHEVLDRYELFALIPFVNSLSIDTTDIPPDEAARRIAEYYGTVQRPFPP
jgi:chloramphenicol 3-O-phosphotransferase